MERMVLGSSREGDLVLDPFLGSGTTARVCQQLNRRCIGIELNPSFVRSAEERLTASFAGFDSMDDRMGRIPNDLSDTTIRKEYLENHARWFLSNHQNDLELLEAEVSKKYGEKKVRRSPR